MRFQLPRKKEITNIFPNLEITVGHRTMTDGEHILFDLNFLHSDTVTNYQLLRKN